MKSHKGNTQRLSWTHFSEYNSRKPPSYYVNVSMKTGLIIVKGTLVNYFFRGVFVWCIRLQKYFRNTKNKFTEINVYAHTCKSRWWPGCYVTEVASLGWRRMAVLRMCCENENLVVTVDKRFECSSHINYAKIRLSRFL